MVVTAAARGREVRQRLVHAAAELIAERGWTGVSTRLVAERAGVTAGLVHYHFASLQALLAEAALGVMREAVEGVAALFEQARSPEAALELILESLAAYTGRDPTSLLITEAYLAATRDDGLREEVGAVVAQFRQRLARWLGEHGVATPDETAAVLAAAIDGIMLHGALDPTVTAESVGPVLRRVLTPAPTRKARKARKGK